MSRQKRELAKSTLDSVQQALIHQKHRARETECLLKTIHSSIRVLDAKVQLAGMLVGYEEHMLLRQGIKLVCREEEDWSVRKRWRCIPTSNDKDMSSAVSVTYDSDSDDSEEESDGYDHDAVAPWYV